MKEINNNIQEAYCSFEVSKLLKEKGFDCYTTTWHQRGNGIVGDVVGRSDRYNSKGEAYTSHPTQALALEWLRVNFGIHIFTKQNFDFHMMPSISTGFNFWITETRDSKYVNRDLIDEDVMCLLYDTPQEAIGAALLYVLKNLIYEEVN